MSNKFAIYAGKEKLGGFNRRAEVNAAMIALAWRERGTEFVVRRNGRFVSSAKVDP